MPANLVFVFFLMIKGRYFRKKIMDIQRRLATSESRRAANKGRVFFKKGQLLTDILTAGIFTPNLFQQTLWHVEHW